MIHKALIVALAALPCSAALADGKLFLSGDVNLVGSLTGDGPGVTDSGNQNFFMNILDGGSNVSLHRGVFDPVVLDRIQQAESFYQSQGVSTTLFADDISQANSGQADLLIVFLSGFGFTADEIDTMDTMLSSGSNILFMGDNGQFASGSNNQINDALGQLGSSMTILNTTFDLGYNTATGTQIAAGDLYAAGVGTLTYAGPSAIDAGSGTELFYGSGNELFVAYETIPAPATCLTLLALPIAARRRRS